MRREDLFQEELDVLELQDIVVLGIKLQKVYEHIDKFTMFGLREV